MCAQICYEPDPHYIPEGGGQSDELPIFLVSHVEPVIVACSGGLSQNFTGSGQNRVTSKN